jgi:RNA polymerase sigma-70 factor, ECF subfamily
MDESPQTAGWLRRVAGGDPSALADLFTHYRARLRRLVQLRLDPRVATRLDPSDVLQEVYLDAAGQVEAYLRQPRVSFYVWLRGLAWERLVKLHRRHLGAECRAVGREQPLPGDISSAGLEAGGTSPGEALVQDELRRRVSAALARLDDDDREVILMRDLEDLSNNEVAEALGLTPSGATMRYGRALFRLKEALRADRPAGESTP